MRDFGGGICEVQTAGMNFNVRVRELTKEQKKVVRKWVKEIMKCS